MKFTVVTIKRIRADYIVEAADERDAWNRVRAFEVNPKGGYAVNAVRDPMEIEHERFVVKVS